MLSVSSGPPTTDIIRSVARRPQDAQTNTPPMTPTQLRDRDIDENVERTPNGRKSDGPDKELSKCSGPLDESETDGLDVKLEEDSGDTRVGFELPFVVCDAILIRM
jgi:hypothetical protein